MHGKPPPEPDSSSIRAPLDPDLLQAAVEASGEAILITSADVAGSGFRIVYANPAFTQMTGYALEEVLRQSPRLLQGPETDPDVLARMGSALAAGTSFQGEAINYRKDGSTYAVEWLITPVRDAAGEVTHWVSAQRDVTARHQAEAHQRLLVRELHHRVRNTLTTVQAIMSATVRSSPTMSEFQHAFAGRMTSLANTHALLTEDRIQAVLFDDLLRAELQPHENGLPARIKLQGPTVELPSELAVPIGMAVHELTTNAAKYGALAEYDGRVEVTWWVLTEPDGQRLRWEWNEHDGPPVALPTREGFGSRLLQRVLTDQIQAVVAIAFEPDGLRVTVDVPLPAAPEPGAALQP